MYLKIVVGGKEGYAPCYSNCGWRYGRVCSLLRQLWLLVMKGILPVIAIVVGCKEGYAPCYSNCGWW